MDNKVNNLRTSNSQFSSPVASRVSTEISTETPEGSIRRSKDLEKRVTCNNLAMIYEEVLGKGGPNQVNNSSSKPNQKVGKKLTEEQKQKIKQAIKNDIAPKIAGAVIAFLTTKVSELAKAALEKALELSPIISRAVNVHNVLDNITSGLKEFFEKTGRALAKVEFVEKILGKVGLILQRLETTADVLEDGKITRNDIIRVIFVNFFGDIGGEIGSFLGKKAGASIGGLLFGVAGVVIGGPIGMVLGGIIGGYLGGEFGNWIAGKIGDKLGPDKVIVELWKDQENSVNQVSPKAASAAVRP